jgi:hypothetical protein
MFKTWQGSPFSNVDLVWKNGFMHGSHNKVKIEIAYIPCASILEFLEGEQGGTLNLVEWNKNKSLALYIRKNQETNNQ